MRDAGAVCVSIKSIHSSLTRPQKDDWNTAAGLHTKVARKPAPSDTDWVPRVGPERISAGITGQCQPS
jgi:hypothetical protein